MGQGTVFCCSRCGHTETALSGIGFRFPEEYRETVEKIQEGKYGEAWKELFGSIPGAAVNAERELYVCPDCGAFAAEANLTIYEMKQAVASHPGNPRRSVALPPTGEEYVLPDELRRDYRLVRTYPHNCPECGKRMHRLRPDDRMKCPVCKEGEMKPQEGILWD